MYGSSSRPSTVGELLYGLRQATGDRCGVAVDQEAQQQQLSGLGDGWAVDQEGQFDREVDRAVCRPDKDPVVDQKHLVVDQSTWASQFAFLSSHAHSPHFPTFLPPPPLPRLLPLTFIRCRHCPNPLLIPPLQRLRSPSPRFSAAQQSLFIQILIMALQSVVQKMPDDAVQAATRLLHAYDDANVSNASSCPQGALCVLTRPIPVSRLSCSAGSAANG
ncbi:unnamed protein product [Closterium sp. NIES-54]